jgi:hypothetical protein
MAEIKEQRSAFASLDKDVIQEWLAHPGTIELARIINTKIAEAKKNLENLAEQGLAYRCDENIALEVRSTGATLRALGKVISLFEEAQSYANSI